MRLSELPKGWRNAAWLLAANGFRDKAAGLEVAASELEAALAEQDDGDLKALVRALAGLVNLKRYKDKNGKDSTYMRLQPEAWREAEETLKGHLIPEPPMSDDPHGSASDDRVS